MLIVTDVGIGRALETFLGVRPYVQKTYHLYRNNYTPLHSSVTADFTEPIIADYPGYAPKPVGSWSAAAVAGSIALSLGPILTWTPTAEPPDPVNIFGYFVTDPDNMTVWAEKFESGPITIATVFDLLTWPPLFTQKSQF